MDDLTRVRESIEYYQDRIKRGYRPKTSANHLRRWQKRLAALEI